jgi:hypothetical protein
MALVYHTFFKEYHGADAESVLQAVHADAHTGTGMTYREWWQWQQHLWQRRYQLEVPPPEAPAAADRLLGVLVRIGALKSGPRIKARPHG